MFRADPFTGRPCLVSEIDGEIGEIHPLLVLLAGLVA